MNAPLPLAESALAAHDLSYTINGAPLLSHVSLCIRKGENLGIVGPNGSGKSTLIRLLAGLQTPTAGRVWLNGERLTSLTRRDIAQRLAVVEQHAQTSDSINAQIAAFLKSGGEIQQIAKGVSGQTFGPSKQISLGKK